MNRVWKKLLGLLVAVILVSMPFLTNAQTVNVNKDGWLDEVVFFPEKDLAKAIDMMTKGDMDVFFKDIDDPGFYLEGLKKILNLPILCLLVFITS